MRHLIVPGLGHAGTRSLHARLGMLTGFSVAPGEPNFWSLGGALSGELGGYFKLFADDVTFRSPVVFKPYEGRDALLVLLGAVVQVFEDFRYLEQVETGDTAVLMFAAKVGDRELQGVDILRFGADDRIVEMTVMVRPMSGMHALAERMSAMLEAAGASPPA